jgi:hypothetical protein
VADSFTVVAVYVNRDLKIRAKKGRKLSIRSHMIPCLKRWGMIVAG